MTSEQPKTPIKLGLNDKNGQELFAGDSVQIVNGVHSGKVIYNVRVAPKNFTLIGDLDQKDVAKGTLSILTRKVMRLQSK